MWVGVEPPCIPHPAKHFRSQAKTEASLQKVLGVFSPQRSLTFLVAGLPGDGSGARRARLTGPSDRYKL